MDRVTPEQVEEAYRATGFQPSSRVYRNSKNKTACGLGVLSVGAKSKDGTGLLKDDGVIEWVANNFHPAYDRGFSYAFYGNQELSKTTLDEDRDGICQQAFADGKACREYLKSKGYKIRSDV